MATIDIDVLTGPAAPFEHCGKPMRWRGSSTSWEGEYRNGYQQTVTDWACECGATMRVTVRVPS